MSWRLGTGGWKLGDRGWIGISVGAVVLLTTVTVSAQTSAERYEVGGGVRFVGPEPFGRVDANETNPGGGQFKLFTADSTLHALVGLEARFGVRVTTALRLEAMGSYGASDLNVTLNSDAEGAASVTASERIRQFTLEGAAVMELTPWRFGAGGMPFLSGGAGYLRALHDDRALVDTGALWFAGGGVDLLFGSTGLRFDARALFQRGVINDDVHATPALGASVFMRF
jgi:hypothetical protein